MSATQINILVNAQAAQAQAVLGKVRSSLAALGNTSKKLSAEEAAVVKANAAKVKAAEDLKAASREAAAAKSAAAAAKAEASAAKEAVAAQSAAMKVMAAEQKAAAAKEASAAATIKANNTVNASNARRLVQEAQANLTSTNARNAAAIAETRAANQIIASRQRAANAVALASAQETLAARKRELNALRESSASNKAAIAKQNAAVREAALVVNQVARENRVAQAATTSSQRVQVAEMQKAQARARSAAQAELAAAKEIQSDIRTATVASESALKESAARQASAYEAQRAAQITIAADLRESAASAQAASVTAASEARQAAAREASAAASVAAAGKAATAAQAAAAKQVAANNAVAASTASLSRQLTASGSRMQWIGRQMAMSLTAPLLLVAGLGVKANLEFSKSMANLNKVYSNAVPPKIAEQEITALGNAMTALSNKFGVAAEEAAEIAADWARVGSSGKDLAEQTALTLQTMIVGELDATEATQGLIAVQAQWGLEVSNSADEVDKSTGKLKHQTTEVQSLESVMRELNAVSNTTGATMGDLVGAFARSSLAARNAGMSTRELAAMVGTMVTYGIPAAEAGNSLKTVVQRLFKPTARAAEALETMNIGFKEAGWESKNFSQRLEAVSKGYNKLTQAQKIQLASDLFGKHQANRGMAILSDMAKGVGIYARTLDTLSDRQRVADISHQELMTVLKSSPQMLKQSGQIIRNSLMKATVELLPIIVQLTQWLGKLFNSFSNLSPQVRTTILAVLAFVAVLGPAIMFAGLMKLALGSLAPFFGFIARMIMLPLMPLKLLTLGFWSSAIASVRSSKIMAASVAAIRTLGAVMAGTAMISLAVGKAVVAGARVAALATVAAWRTSWAAMVMWQAITGTVLTTRQMFTFALMLTIQNTWAAASAALMRAWSAVQGAIMATWAIVGPALTAAWAAATLTIQRTWRFASIAIFNLWKASTIAVQTAWAVASTMAMATWKAATLVIAGSWRTAWLTITFAWAASALAIKRGFVAASAALMTAWRAGMLAITYGWAAATLAIQKAWALASILLQGSTWKALISLASGGVRGLVMAVGRGAMLIVGALASPWAIAIGAVLGLIVIFRTQIAQAIKNVIAYFQNLPAGVKKGLQPIANVFNSIKNAALKAFNALPNGIKAALLRVVAIIRAAAMKIYELFSYINPFARHSPSLVENVNNGMSVIDARFAASARRAQASIGSMHSSVKKLQGLSKGLVDSNTAAEHDKVRSNARQAGVGNAIPEYDRLVKSVAKAKNELNGMSGALEAQKAKVKAAEDAVKAYDDYINKLNQSLAQMQAIQDSVGRSLDGAKSRYDRFANAQIAGSRAAEDAIFANTMAQKKLQLQIAKLEEESGTIDSVSDSYSKLQGEIETLTAKQTELRRSGAGSDILNTYDKMISDLRAQQNGLMSGTTDGPAAKINNLNLALEKLKKQAETMELEKSLQFDQLNRNIEQFKSNVEEMPYGQIMSGMDSSRTSVNALQFSYDSLGFAMEGQNARIAEATRQRDRLQQAYDAESKKLESMQEVFDALEESIRSSEQAMQDFASAAETAVSRAEEARRAAESAAKKGAKGKGGKGGSDDPAADFLAAGDEDFATFGGDSPIGRSGPNDISQAGDIDAFTKNLQDDLEAQLGSLNPFKPLMNWWNKTVDWFNNIKEPLGNFFGGIGSAVKSGFTGKEFDPAKNAAIELDSQLKRGAISLEDYNKKMKELGQDTSVEAQAQRARDAISQFNEAGQGENPIMAFFRKIGDAIQPAWEWIKKIGELLATTLGGPIMENVRNLLSGMGDAWAKILPSIVDFGKELWQLAKAVFPYLVIAFGAIIGTAKILFSIIAQAIIPVFKFLGTVISSVIDVITGIMRVISGILNVVTGVVQTIIGVIKGIFTGDFSGAIDGLKKIFVDGFGKILKGIGQIIWSIIKTVVSLFKNMGELVFRVIWGFVKGVIGFFVDLWDVLVGHSIVPDTIKAIIDWFKSLPGKILSGLWSFIKAVIGFFLKLPGMILSALAGLAKIIWNVFSSAFMWLVQNGPALLMNVLTWIASIPVKIFEFLGDIGAKLLEWMAAGWSWLVENGPSMLVSLGEWLISIPGWLFGMLGDIGSKLLEWMKAGWNWLVANAPGLLTGLISWLVSLPLKILGWLGSLGSKLVEWMGAAWNWLVDNLPGILSKFWNWVKDFPSNFIRGLGVIGSKLGDWISSAWGWVVDNAPKLLSKLWEWLKGLPGQIVGKLGDAGKMLFDYGKNMIQGLIDGAGSLLKKIGEFMLDKLPGWIKTPFKKAMGIASPSKVFAGYGKNLGEGLIEGMDGMAPQVEAASSTMAEAAKAGDFTAQMDVVAAADTSSAAGAVSSIGSAVAADGTVGASVAVDPATELAAAQAQLTAFTQAVQAQVAAFVAAVIASIATIGTNAGLTFTNMNLVATAQMAAMVTAITSSIATLTTTVQTQLATLLAAINTFGTSLNAAWLAIWTAFGSQTTTSIDLTLSEWERMALGMENTLESGIRPVFDEMDLMLENMENSFVRTVESVGQVWDGIREKTAAPARFVINDVYNGGIRGAWNKFNKFLDLEELPEFTASFAKGGAVHGKGTGTSDSIDAKLSRGEHVITAAEVRKAGGHGEIYKQRELWRRGKNETRNITEAFRYGGPVGEDVDDPHAKKRLAQGGSVQLGNVSAEGITTPIQQAMWDAVRTAFPQVVLHSATRTVDVGSGYDYHMQGMALDVSPSPEIARWIYEMNETNPVLELIHWPLAGWQNLKNGAPLDYGPGTNAGHMDHVHWAMNTMVDNEGKVVSMGPMGAGVNPVNYKKLVEDGINKSMDEVLDRDPKFGGGIGEWVPASIEKGRKDLLEFLGPKAEKLSLAYGGSKNYGPGGNIPYNLSAGVEQWRKLATEMLIMQGQSPTYTDRLLMQMNSESGGNPNAINLWDSNAAKGTPSKGLMQVIDPTFAANRDPRLPDDIWDPAANIAASIRYTTRNYGSLDAWQGVGYDSGGILPPGFTIANNQTGGPEAILTAAQWSAMFDIATKKPLEGDDVQDAMENALHNTGNTGDKNTQAIIKGMDVWSKGWTPAMIDAAGATTDASKSVSKSVDQAAGTTLLLSKSIGKYNTEITALSKLLNAISASAQQSYKVTVNTKTGETTQAGNANVRKNGKGEVVVDVEGPTFSAWAPTINAVADLLDALPYAERDWDADNPVAGETEKERKARIAQNNMTNYTKGLWNITKDVGPPLLRHTAIIGAAAERLVQEDGTAWTTAVTMIATGNQLGWFILVPLILKTLAVMLPLILAAILDIVPALIRAIVRFLTQFMPDSVYAYADMGAAEAAAQEQYDDGTVAKGQGQRYPTDAMRTTDSNAPVNLYMYGDLVMPNVSDGSDANDFVDQLKLLASS